MIFKNEEFESKVAQLKKKNLLLIDIMSPLVCFFIPIQILTLSPLLLLKKIILRASLIL